MTKPHPPIIQGGMGAAVSNWKLANAVARRGQLGVVSGTALDLVVVRRLQTGDPGGHMRRALAHFPDQGVANRIIDQYFLPDGLPPGGRFASVPMFRADATHEHLELNIAASFAEVWLAAEGHDGPVGINLLEKIAFPTLSALYGAILAGVDYVIVGAGIPWQIPGILDKLARSEAATMKVAIEGGRSDTVEVTLDPTQFFSAPGQELPRPRFLAIVSSHTLAQALIKRATSVIDGFVVEHWTAGGHNAPPRGAMQLTESGEPLYGQRDVVDLQKLRDLGVPFWLAGGSGTHAMLQEALAAGAAGVQVGTAFAFCDDSGLDPELRRAVLRQVRDGGLQIFTDPDASPTGFPFKVVPLEGTLSAEDLYTERPRVCDLGYLRHPYRREDGEVGYRCPAEPVADYVKKGGDAADTEGRKCLCNALMANIGMGQNRPRGGFVERPLLTAGDDVSALGRFLPDDGVDYTAEQVIDAILTGTP